VSEEYLNLNIGALKRAAIDAWMNSHSNGWWEIDGSHYRVTGGDATVTRPGEDGEGGGDWDGNFFLTDWIVDGDKDEEYTTQFNNIRTRIDNALKDWDHNLLPKPKTSKRTSSRHGRRCGCSRPPRARPAARPPALVRSPAI
jgi:hypothetical protein